MSSPALPGLADLAWPDVREGATVLVPLGSTEQHGPHLPLDTDTVIATAVARGLAPLVGGVVAPAVPVGASGEHQAFPGTVSIGVEVLTSVLVELGRSLTEWAGRVVLVNGHGGNLAAVRAAVALLREEGRTVDWVPCAVTGADAHAGHTETSVMLHLDPTRVRTGALERGNVEPIDQLLPVLREQGVRGAAANGVLGDPTGATAEHGAEILAAMVRNASDRLAVGAR
jgi:creatinine amidohydrolase